ncbi:MAG: putative rane protein [Ramlibacter sp.]|nr:putative rane protein [Ramlibacter sp.]
MATPRTLARLDTLVWTLIFGGLFTLVLGIASHDETAIGGWSLSVLGTLATAAGVVLIYVRSRLRETPEPGAQSNKP